MPFSCQFWVLAPESGLDSVDLPTSKTSDRPSTAGGRQDRRQVAEKGIFPLFLTAPHLTPSVNHLSVALVTRTQRGSIQPRGKLKPHGLATSCCDRDNLILPLKG